jgi:hypothetical protein
MATRNTFGFICFCLMTNLAAGLWGVIHGRRMNTPERVGEERIPVGHDHYAATCQRGDTRGEFASPDAR